MTVFSERVRTAREAAGLSQNRLAHRINDLTNMGYNDTNIRKWEQGKAWPHASVIPHIADVLGVSIDYLYGLTDDPQGEGPDPFAPLKK